MRKREYIILTCITLGGFFLSLLFAYKSGTLALTSFDALRDDAGAYNRQALALLDQRTLGEKLGDFRKPPGYPFFLAGTYGVFGRHPISAWSMQVFLFGGLLWMVYAISTRLIEGLYKWIPVVCTAGYWGILFYVFKLESELTALFLLVAYTYAAFLVWETGLTWRRTFIGGLLLALLILTKPIILYASPVCVGFFVHKEWQLNRKRAVFHTFGVWALVVLLAGGWMMRNYLITGDYQIEQHTGHIVWVRGAVAELPPKEIMSYALAVLAGDLIADYVFPGYADNPVPYRFRGQVTAIQEKMKKEGAREHDTEKFFLETGSRNIITHAPGFVLTSFLGVFALNEPVNHKGFSLAHLFTYTHEYIPYGFKIFIILIVRIGWFMFLGVVLYGLRLAWQRGRAGWRFIIFLMVYFNSMYALIIVPAEPRFLVPVLPFYFLCFGAGISCFLTRVKKICSVKAL